MRITATISLCLALAACDLDIPDEANPAIEDLLDNPTRANVGAAATGLLIGSRGNVAAANGYIAQLGILGREAYNFDQADPRFVEELLAGQLNAGSPFGGNFWAGPYANIRTVHIVVGAASRVPDFSAAEIAAIQGFAKTVQAVDLLEALTTRDANGIVVNTDCGDCRDIGPPQPIVGRDEGLTFVANLLDEANTLLGQGGEDFPQPLSSGFAGFDTPATFAQFNRALRARVAAYQQDHQGILDALAGSFLDDTADLDLGVYYSYSTQPGDAVNNLFSPNIFVHPSVAADAEAGDTRVTTKVTAALVPGGVEGRSADQIFSLYTNVSPVPIIRNEELILLRAEANLGLDNLVEAADDINLIRTTSGGLAALDAGDLDSAEEVEDQLLYNRRYSLLFEGHRLIDLRRFERTDEIPLDLPDDLRNVRFPIPLPECNARVNEPACDLGST